MIRQCIQTRLGFSLSGSVFSDKDLSCCSVRHAIQLDRVVPQKQIQTCQFFCVISDNVFDRVGNLRLHEGWIVQNPLAFIVARQNVDAEMRARKGLDPVQVSDVITRKEIRSSLSR